ncbi:MAG: MarR family transcriptional regulator [Pseudonocardiaceae bacterium]|nr:MAG: MarR family transcriptional regulator [Pseudonocardiaceae bacterium]
MELDLVTVVHLAGLALNAEAVRRLAAAGHDDVRESHGYLIQHVVEAPRPIGEIAERMEVTQQAVSKAVAELVGLGYLDRTPDPTDARVRRVGLSPRGHELVACSRRIRAEIDAELAATLGDEAAEQLRAGATAVLEWAGGGDAARSRRVRPPS